MADRTLTPQVMTDTGVAPTYTGSLLTADTHIVRNNGRMFLHFLKTGAGACTVTVQTPATMGGKAVAETTFSVPATTGDVMAGPFPDRLYNDGSNDMRFTLSEITGLSVAVVSV